MNSVTLIAFLIFTSASRGSSSFSDITELDSTHSPTTEGPFQTNPDFLETVAPEYQQQKVEEISSNNNGSRSEEPLKQSLEEPAQVLSALNEVTADKSFGNFLLQPIDYQYYTVPSQNENTKLYQAPKRREIKEWKVSDDFFDSNNVPWGVDTYYPRLGHSEYIEGNRYSGEKSLEGPSVIVAGDYKDDNTQVKHPQYFQKNYYYNYYPLVQDRKRWNPDEIYIPSSDDPKPLEIPVGRKPSTANPCKQYLEFLRYAFERLDDSSEYYYEPSAFTNEEYSEEFRLGENRELDRTHGAFGTQLLGPTFYVDNSGKISQVNTNGNSVQVAEGISPGSRISIFSKTVTKPNPVTEETTQSTTTFYEPLSTTPVFIKSNTGNRLFVTEPENNQKSETETPTPATIPPTVQTNRRPVTEFVTLPTVASNDNNSYYGKIGRPMEKKPFTETDPTTTTRVYPFWFSRTTFPLPTTFNTPTENRIKFKTTLSLEDSTENARSDDANCKDKMLPCPDTVNITYPLNGYCNRYVSCESGRAIRRTCPDGLHFNLIIKSCDLPHNSFCTYICPQPNGNFGIPGDCGGYFVCKNSHPEYRMCPPRMHWDVNRNSCTFSQLSSCPMKCFRDNEVRHYEGDCKAYIVCLNGVPYYHKCPPNTKFDSKNLVCVPDHKSTCLDDPRLMTKTLNPNALCKDVQIQLNTHSWCRSFMPYDKQLS